MILALSRLFSLATLVALLAGPAWAQTFPPLSGRVVDAANILPPEVEARLDQELAALEAQTRDQLVVATVPSLQGHEIEDYGYRLGRHWGLGQEKADNGAILLVAPNERRVRIEVGYGLEPVLTDALSSLIIQRQVLPRFRQGNLPGGVEAGAQAIVAQLSRDRGEAVKIAQQAAEKRQGGSDAGSWFWVAIILLWIFLSVVGRRSRRRPGSLATAILWGLASGGRGGGWHGGGGGGGGFSGGGGSFGGGGSSGSW